MTTRVSNGDLERSLGRVEGDLEATKTAMERRMDRIEQLMTQGFADLKNSIGRISDDVSQLKTRETERKGGWRVVVAIASFISGIVASLLTAFIKAT